MRDNGNSVGSGAHVQIKPVHWARTEHQIAKHEGFRPESLRPREPAAPSASDKPTMRLAEPPAWAQRDDLPCTKLVPKRGQPDLFDTSDEKVARALCAGCPLEAKRACLADAMAEEGDLSDRSRWLVRGGLTPKQRAVRALSNG
jgi:WhiB family redox-sensing transcriptional regulator